MLLSIQKELNITRGWLKPKRLLEVTGPTAQEVLKQEAKAKKMARRHQTQALPEDESNTSKIIEKSSNKPPRAQGPIIKTRAGPKITLQGLIDQYVYKEKKK